jgi:hypothetical protein
MTGKTYAEMTGAERVQAWLDIPDDDPFASPLGYQQWAEANEPPKPSRRTPRREGRWGSTRHGWQRRPR